MKRRQFTRVLGLGLLGVRFPSLRRRTDDRFVERWSWAMGQPVHLQLFASDENEGFEAAQKAFAELRRVEGALSLFDDGSDLCEVNRHSGGLGPRVGSDLATVLERGLYFERETRGAFNPAVEPLMRAWGFHARRTTEPSEAEIIAARDAVRASKVVVDGTRVTLP